MKPGMMLLLGGGKSKSEKGPPSDETEPEETSSGAHEMAGEAFDALQDGDREGFTAAFVEAVKQCASKARTGGYAEEEDDDSEDF